ncbi:MAG: twitching motility protein PilT [bacterium]|nr:MAG: twitching motility protein PilT [bacterium]
MIYMLDTNMCSYIIRSQPLYIKEKLKETEKNNTVSLSSIVVSELFYGAYKKNSDRLIKVIEDFINSFEIYEYGLNAAKEYGLIRADLERQGLIIGAYDMQIAAHAAALDAVLVTNNEREFKRIKELTIKNWTKKR